MPSVSGARAAAAAALSHVSETAKSDPAKKKKKKKLFSIAKTSRSGTGGVSAVLKRLQAAQRRWNGDSVDAGSNGPTMAGPTDAVRRPKAERVAAALHGEWCAAQLNRDNVGWRRIVRQAAAHEQRGVGCLDA